jgi:hypothetical protein
LFIDLNEQNQLRPDKPTGFGSVDEVVVGERQISMKNVPALLESQKL